MIWFLKSRVLEKNHLKQTIHKRDEVSAPDPTPYSLHFLSCWVNKHTSRLVKVIPFCRLFLIKKNDIYVFQDCQPFSHGRRVHLLLAVGRVVECSAVHLGRHGRNCGRARNFAAGDAVRRSAATARIVALLLLQHCSLFHNLREKIVFSWLNKWALSLSPLARIWGPQFHRRIVSKVHRPPGSAVHSSSVFVYVRPRWDDVQRWWDWDSFMRYIELF